MRVLTDADVERLLPPPMQLVELTRDALVALAEGRADVPPKPAVHPHGPGGGAFANAMPAAYTERNLLGCKWISIFPGNPARGLPTATGLMVVNDGDTGLPVCVMQAAALTAARTAAVSGACISTLAPPDGSVAVLGAGVQARSHLRVLEALGHHDVTVFARRVEALEELQAWSRAHTPQVELRTAGSRRDCVSGADVVVTALSIGLVGTQLDPAWLREEVLLLPLDYASSVGPDTAATGVLTADHLPQFEALRTARSLGQGYPAPTTWTGALLTGGRPSGRVTCQNLGNGLSDLVVAAAVANAAEAEDAGQIPGG